LVRPPAVTIDSPRQAEFVTGEPCENAGLAQARQLFVAGLPPQLFEDALRDLSD
jgi:hypothetical protein